ncbi:uncharacterized protein LOC144160628 [Haemaphysalis longicornis]
MMSSAATEDGRNPVQREAFSTGPIEQFNLSPTDEWEDYAQRFEFFLEAQGIMDTGKKRSTFLSRCGAATFPLAKALVAPDKLKDTPHEDIITALRNHISQKPPELARRYEFHRREQATALQLFGLDKALRDRFVFGLKNDKAKRRILAKKEVSLACAVEEATAAEAIDREASQTYNYRTTLRASTSYCDNRMETAIHDVPQPVTKKIHVVVEIEGVECEMEVDSGSTFSLISEATARKIFPKGRIPKLKQLDIVMKDYQGNCIVVQGMATVIVKFRGFGGPLKLVIVKAQLQSLLGLDWFPALRIKVTGVHRMDELATAFYKLFEEFAVVFDGGLACYKEPPVKLALNPEVVPVRLKARRVPFALRQKIDAEFDKLLQQGLLEPVDCAQR